MAFKAKTIARPKAQRLGTTQHLGDVSSVREEQELSARGREEAGDSGPSGDYLWCAP